MPDGWLNPPATVVTAAVARTILRIASLKVGDENASDRVSGAPVAERDHRRVGAGADHRRGVRSVGVRVNDDRASWVFS